MGGTKEEIEIGQAISQAWQDLDIVHFYINFSGKGNFNLFNQNFYNSVPEEVKKYFEQNGITYNYLGPVDGYGSGFENLIEIFKKLWENRDLISFFFSISSFAKKKYQDHINNKIKFLRPRVNLYFYIETNSNLEKIDNNRIRRMLTDKMANLIQISNAICKHLSEKHTYLYCDLSVSGKINSKNYSSSFELTHEERTSTKINRFLDIIKDIHIKNNLATNHKFTSFGLVERLDKCIKKNDKKLIEVKTEKKYFLLFSNNIIKDFIK